ncbi:tRNA (N6-isopentenyl adenosine(37)-C2)-methylthiotransferase MiaB [Candidatus Poribacteria bacterium]|nr:tRNA (N6-isopentenyl adenosine(37)-C2)-methylthiotransferase MiaB [Candidatus Poribacteria bacterium]
MSQTYSIITYGCQMNEHDSEIMDGLLGSRGLKRTEEPFGADVVLFNTCTVRDGAESRAFGRIQSLLGAKRQNPEMIIAICGCAAQDKGLELLERFPHVDLVVGTRDYVKIDQLVEEVRRSGQRFVSVEDIDKPLSLPTVPVRRSGLKAFINIMFGCNNRCTFCIVPQTRGAEYSRPLAEIVREAEQLVDQGFREVCLLGQNVNSYMDEKRNDFSSLLHALDGIGGLWRIRYTTSNPKSARERHLRAVAECSKVMEHLHLPVQSGNDRVLRAMKRAYNIERYKYLVSMYRELCPGGSLTTDMIAGFPSETEAEFEDTLRLTREMRFDQQFMFMYSPRRGTAAAETMAAESVPLEIKKDRIARLIALQESISLEINQAEAGRVHEVLVEGPARRGDSLMGRTRTDKTVIFEGPESMAGQLVSVRITGGQSHTLFGELAVPALRPAKSRPPATRRAGGNRRMEIVSLWKG